MRIVTDFIRENKKKLLLVLLLIVVLAVISFVMSNQRSSKIYSSEYYIYTKETYDHDDNLVSTLPYINIKGDEISQINTDLIKRYYEVITVDKQFMTYTFYKNDSILSLIVKIYDKISPDSYPSEVLIYNVDINEKKIITDDQLLVRFGISEDEVSEIIRDELKEYYDYEIKSGYVTSECNFECYLYNTNSLPILDGCSYFVRDGYLYVYKSISLNGNFFYDTNSGFNLFNFKIKEM